MSDHLAAQITIGGCISRALAPGLCAAIRDERAALDWGESPFAPTSVEELLAERRVIDGESVLQLCDTEARYGRFDTLEAYLVKRRIPFDRRTEGRFDYAPELVAYRPEEERWVFATNNRELVAPVEPLWEFEATLERFRRRVHRGPRAALRADVDQLIADFRRSVPSRPAPLPAFEIGRSVGLRSAA